MRPSVAAAWALGIIAAVVTGTLWVRGLRQAESPHPSGGSISWEAAFRTGEHLAAEGRFAEAIPHYRTGITQQGATEWRTHYALAIALRNLTVDSSIRFGLRGPGMRSSYEGVQTVREALDEMATALRLARRPEDIALVARLAGQIYVNWGFVWDPFFIYRQGERYDTSGDFAQIGDALLGIMQNPATSVEGHTEGRAAMPGPRR